MLDVLLQLGPRLPDRGTMTRTQNIQLTLAQTVKGAEIAGERPGIGSDENATFAEYRIAGEARPLEEQCEVIRGVSGCGESLERPKASPFGELYVDVSTTGAQHASSRTDGSQSECGAKLGRRDGGDLDCASAARPDATPEDPRHSSAERVGLLHCGAGLQERETLARRRPARALGRVGAFGCAETVPPRHRVQTDSGAHQRIGSAGAA